jgi:hypothetical protein
LKSSKSEDRQRNPQEAEEPTSKSEFDNLLRRMLATPPKPHVKQEKKNPGK